MSKFNKPRITDGIRHPRDFMLHLINALETTDVTQRPETSRTADIARSFLQDPSLDSFMNLKNSPVGDSEQSFYACTQIKALFSKRDDLVLGIDAEAVALDTFLKAENHCTLYNRSLDVSAMERDTLIFRVSRKIASILGPVPDVSTLDYGFGPGTNVGLGEYSSVRRKLSTVPTTTLGALSFYKGIAHNFPSLTSQLLNGVSVVQGAKFTSVPKTSLTDRGINVEPLLNSFLQRGFGRYIRQRLKYVGCDIRDQSINQKYARQGSIDGSLATIDLSMASDTISAGLVMRLLPHDWYCILDDIRSPIVELPDGSFRILAKFSAMGNGFTFELETLIFYALLATLCEDGVYNAYGDDLICPTEYSEQVLKALRLFGFIPNQDKSFCEGPFRESCGKDYFSGVDVRPCFLKSKLTALQIMRLHNYFIRTGRLDPSFMVAYVPASQRAFGPDGCGDGHFISDTLHTKYSKSLQRRYIHYKSWRTVPMVLDEPLSGDFAAALYYAGTCPEQPTSATMYQERAFRPRYRLTPSRQWL